MSCRHRKTTQVGPDRCFTGCVAAPGDCDPRAHGGITWTVRCDKCNATRRVSSNGLRSEDSAWAQEEE